jgi:hypothetical protein
MYVMASISGTHAPASYAGTGLPPDTSNAPRHRLLMHRLLTVGATAHRDPLNGIAHDDVSGRFAACR